MLFSFLSTNLQGTNLPGRSSYLCYMSQILLISPNQGNNRLALVWYSPFHAGIVHFSLYSMELIPKPPIAKNSKVELSISSQGNWK